MDCLTTHDRLLISELIGIGDELAPSIVRINLSHHYSCLFLPPQVHLFLKSQLKELEVPILESLAVSYLELMLAPLQLFL